MTFKELQAAMTAAMKEKNKVKKNVIANMVACAKNMAIEQGCKDNITDEIVAKAILKSKKICQEQIDTCPINRPSLLESYKLCMTYIDELAPKMMDRKEVKESVEKILIKMSLNSREPFNKGMAMKAIMAELKGKADGKMINQIVTEILASR